MSLAPDLDIPQESSRCTGCNRRLLIPRTLCTLCAWWKTEEDPDDPEPQQTDNRAIAR
jgi:hypothetical protein